MAKRVILVTGANKGIGYAICERLLGLSPLKDEATLAVNKNVAENPVHVILAARNQQRLDEAVDSFKKRGATNISGLLMDVDDAKSIEAAAGEVKKTYGKLFGLINNAAIAWKGNAFDETVARTTLHTNYYGLKAVCNAFMPLMQEGGRIVNVSSVSGKRALQAMSQQLRQKWLREDLTVAELDRLVEDFTTAVKEGNWKEKGWPESCYGISKAAVTVYTRILARDNKIPGLLINAAHPGYVNTDMTSHKGILSPAEGAITPTHLALLPADCTVTGAYWDQCKAEPIV